MSGLFCSSPQLCMLERQMQQPPGYRPRGQGICIMNAEEWKSRGNYTELVDCVISSMQMEHLKKRISEIFEKEDKEIIFGSMKHRKDFYFLLTGRRGKNLCMYPNYAAAVFLLSADEKLWDKVHRQVLDTGIYFDRIRLGGVTLDQYILFHAARDEFVTLRKFLTMEEFKSEHLSEELEIATHFLKEPEAEEIRQILMERAKVGDVQRAAAFYKIIRYSYGSGCTSYGCQPFDIRKTFTIIWEANRRLKDTVIENKDFEALIRQYDRPNAFFYCDPPYFETEGHYEVVFRKEDHVRLRDTLAGIQGKFMVSYNDCEYIRELYQDFQIESVKRINNLAQRYDNGCEYPEVLIAKQSII